MGKYTEIFKLKAMLEKANIPFTFTANALSPNKIGYIYYRLLSPDSYPAYQIWLNKDVDVIQHHWSYGNEQDLLEIMGGLTVEENERCPVLGYLTAEEVFKRFKYCYENNTSIYKKEEEQ